MNVGANRIAPEASVNQAITALIMPGLNEVDGCWHIARHIWQVAVIMDNVIVVRPAQHGARKAARDPAALGWHEQTQLHFFPALELAA